MHVVVLLDCYTAFSARRLTARTGVQSRFTNDNWACATGSLGRIWFSALRHPNEKSANSVIKCLCRLLKTREPLNFYMHGLISIGLTIDCIVTDRQTDNQLITAKQSNCNWPDCLLCCLNQWLSGSESMQWVNQIFHNWNLNNWCFDELLNIFLLNFEWNNK